jgi:hypothetical protein
MDVIFGLESSRFSAMVLFNWVGEHGVRSEDMGEDASGWVDQMF